MRRYSLTNLRLLLAIAASCVASLTAVTSAQAVVATETSNGNTYGVALMPQKVGADLIPAGPNSLSTTGFTTPDPRGATCPDPWLESEFAPLLTSALCWHPGGTVMHGNETFAFTWDMKPYHNYAANYVEDFLKDAANARGSLDSPYAITTQYRDGIADAKDANNTVGRAENASLYGGGWDDPTDYPGYPGASVCSVSPNLSQTGALEGYGDIANSWCLTDSQIRSELQTLIQQHALDQTGAVQPGYTPLLVLMTPPGVEVCIDGAGKVCSANSDPTSDTTSGASAQVDAQFCSYHSYLTDPATGKVFDYVVQPWSTQTLCDEPDAPKFPTGGAIDAETLRTDMGARLVSPLSQSQIASIVNPGLNGWYATDGSEINDNGCVPLGHNLDQVAVDGVQYELQREFNNAGTIINDPWALPCSPLVVLEPNFVVPSAVNAGDVIQFDASKSPQTLLVPNLQYQWELGDGTKAIGPSVQHSYSKAGNYNVKLTVTDRGNNTATVTEQIVVLGPDGQPADAAPTTPTTPTPPTTPAPTTGGGPGGSTSGPALNVHLQMLPQSLKSVLSKGIAVRVTSNRAANGIATVWITRSVAKRAHIKTGKSPVVRIGIGTVSSIKDGRVTLRLHLSRTTAKKLRHLRHVSLTVRLALVSAGNHRISIVAAGRY